MVRSPDGGAALALLLMLSLGFLGHNALAQKSPKAFLQPHNAARAEVGVAKLSWNTTLAAYARRYAGRRAEDCKLVHSRGPYGENIFWGSAGRRWAAADAVASWVKEKANVRISQASSYFFLHQKKRANYDCGSNRCRRRKCGHYTQVVWANTKRVGCAAVDCHGGGGGTFIVCSYDPPGNVDGKPPYPRCGRYNRVAVV